MKFLKSLHLLIALSILTSTMTPLVPASVAQAASPAIQRATPSLQPELSALVTTAETESSDSSMTEPSEWNGYGEVLARRDAFTRHYDLGEGRMLAEVSDIPRHYQMGDGSWQPIDARFEAVEQGFVMRHNLLRATLGITSSQTLIQVGQSALGWSPQALLASSDGGVETLLAQPLTLVDTGESVRNHLPEATLNGQRTLLTYRQHWSDATLAETFSTDVGSMEQSLVLAQPPQVAQNPTLASLPAWIQGMWNAFTQPNVPQSLVFESELYLFSGETLWVNGRKQQGSFSTAESPQQTLEVRNAAGERVLGFAPVIAYEQADPSTRVAGYYAAEELDPNVWRLRIVTPWSWWVDPARVYPAVLDPEIYVEMLKPTTITRHYAPQMVAGVECGIYVPSDGAADALEISVGTNSCLPEGAESYQKSADFTIQSTLVYNKLPVLPTVADISGATLVLNGMLLGDEVEIEILNGADQSLLDTYTLSSETLVDDCSDENCNPRLTPTSNLTASIELDAAKIIPVLEAWYNGQNSGLRLRTATQNGTDDCAPTLTALTQADGILTDFTLECAFVSTSGPRLLIHYATPALAAGGMLLNQPIPSLSDGEQIGRSDHTYQTGNLAQDWSVLAVLGNTAQNRNVYTPLQVLDKTSRKTGTAGANNRRVDYVVLDNTSNQLPASVQVHVQDAAENADPSVIADANYDLHWAKPHQAPLPKPSTTWSSVARGFGHSELVGLFPFELEAEHSLSVRVIVSESTTLHVELFPTQPGLFDAQAGDPLYDPYVAVRGESPSPPPASAPDGNGNRIFSLDSKSASLSDQRWALVIAHEGANDLCPNPPPGVAAANAEATSASGCPNVTVVIETLACPPGEYPTLRFGCQSLLYPHEQVSSGVIIPPSTSDGALQSAEATSPDALDVVVPRTATYDVGTVRIFSEGGFVGDEQGEPAPALAIYGGNFKVCTTGEEKGMPLLGLTSDAVPANGGQAPAERLIPVQQGSVCVDASNRIHIVGTTSGDGTPYGAVVAPSIRESNRRPVRIYNGNLSLYHGRIDLGAKFGTLEAGAMLQNQSNPFRLDPIGLVQIAVNPWAGWVNLPTSFPRFIEIDQRSTTGDQDGTLKITSEAYSPLANGTEVAIDSLWRRRAALSPAGFELTMQMQMNMPNMNIAGLELRNHAAPQAYFQTNSGTLSEIRLLDATIHQPASMGAAYKAVTAVIRKTGMPLREKSNSQLDDDNTIPDCGASRSCLDVRNPSNITSADWQLPDIDIQDNAGTLIMQRAGEIQVFSQDHPDAGKVGSAQVGVDVPQVGPGFNFKAFDNFVTVTIGECDGIENATIIKAQGKIKPPMLDAHTADGVIGFEAGYDVCENKLRHAHIKFKLKPGIPVGATGIALSMLEGEVNITPVNTTIELAIDFASVDGVTVTGGGGRLFIDTAGRFAVGAHAKLVGSFNINGELSVAWKPMDVLLKVEISFQDWLRGSMRMHTWIGKGFNNQYPWITDNEVHFTGAIGATLTLTKARFGQFWKIKLPPVDISLTVEIAFGQFCANDACSKYEWGVQGKIKVLKFSIGLYISRSGVDMLLGDKGKRLLDEAPGIMAASIQALPLGPVSDLADGKTLDFGSTEALCPEANGVATCTFTIEPNTGEAMISVGWADGTLPSATLYAPDGTAINAVGKAPQVDPAYGNELVFYEVNAGGTVQFFMDMTSAFYTIENPQAGTWTLTLGNLTGREHYNVLFAANSVAPVLTLTTPNNVAAGGTLDINWTLSSPATDARVTLAYITADEYAAYNTALSAGASVTEVIAYLGGVQIAPPQPAGALTYPWQVSLQRSGSYYIVARLDHPIHGASYAISPGALTYTDNMAPAVPANLLLTADPGTADGLIASWDRNNEPDLSGYEIVYTIPSLDQPGGFAEKVLTVPPSDRMTGHPRRERVRLVGLIEGMQTTVCVRALDGSNNRSVCSTTAAAAPKQSGVPLHIKPTLSALTAQPGPTLFAQWNAGVANDGYLLSWAYGCGSHYVGPVATQGAPNLDVGTRTDFSLSGLPPGTYRVAVRGYQYAAARRELIDSVTTFSNNLRVLLSDGVDGDSDTLPDDWAKQFEIKGGALDADGDGLTNKQEQLNLTDPRNPDSDGDGYEDGVELLTWLTDPCDPNAVPDTKGSPYLVVTPDFGSLQFEGVVNVGSSDSHQIAIRNRGRGDLNWSASATAPWIKLSATNGGPLRWYHDRNTLTVSVDLSGLAPGYYEGKVRVASSNATPVRDAVQIIPVRLWVLRDWVRPKTKIEGYVFIDQNGNGKQDPEDTGRSGEVTVQLLNSSGALLLSQQAQAGTGAFTFSGVALASYSVAAKTNNPELLVTTPNPQPVVLASDPAIVTLAIGVKREALLNRDLDGDTLLDLDEDLNRNGNFDDDDSDQDGIANYRDADDDGDTIPTRNERTLGDSDGDQSPNYLDPDDDNDGVLTALEGSGDANGNNIADYLEKEFVGTGGGSQRVFLPIVAR